MKNTNQQDINTPLVAEAKNWYESAYPTGNSKLSTMATTTDGPDYIQMFKPDWKHTATYARFNDDVIELPLDEATSTKLGIGLKSDEATDPVYDQAYSHSSFLMLKRNGKYRSFIMTIIADPAYLKNDLSKLNGNKYNKRDSDFTGVVLYATPKGKFINGWCYKNGKITEHIAPGKITDTTTTTGKRNTTQGIKTNTYSVTTCKTWLQISYVVGSSLPPTVTELETKCTTVNFDTGGGSGSGSGSSSGNGGAGGGSGTSTSPDATSLPPCDQATPSMESTRIVLNGNTSGGHTPTDPYNPTNPTGPTNPNDPNPGFPPPDDPGPTVSPCYVVNTITNNVQNPCLKNMVDSTMVSGISNQINSLIKDVFGGTEKLNLTFVDNVTLASGVEGHTEMNGGFDDFGNLNIQIQLNKDELPGYSQQYIATVIMHEALHAYLEAKGVDPKNQHENIIIDYVNKMSASLKIMFPGLTLSDAKNLSLGGLDQTTTFLYTVARDMKLSGDFAATQSAYSIGSLGKRCK